MSLAVVPVKALEGSKSRLLPELQQAQLEALSLAMLSDVLIALLDTPSLERVVTLTPDAAVANTARALGADALQRPDAGLNAAIDAAARDLAAGSDAPFLVVLGDVAGAEGSEIEKLFETLRDGETPGAVLAPSSDGGTAALLRAPHDAMPACFGRDSASRHRAAAQAAGIAFREIALPSLSLDLDCAEDLETFAHREGQGAQTRTLLRSMGWGKPGDA
jgi:2-phospho-L-lactate guanylyltransferase